MGLGKSSPLSTPARTYSELFDEDGKPRFDVTNVSPEELISPYYGGKRQAKEELDKALAYARARGGRIQSNAEEAYQKYFEPIVAGFDLDQSSHYSPDALKVEGKKYPSVKIAGDWEPKRRLEEIKKYKANEMTSVEKARFNMYLEDNGYTVESLEKSLKSKPEADSLEHEVGHHYTLPFANRKEKMYQLKGDGEKHMTNQSELVNVVGRIQRERFKMGQGRFENENDLREYISKTPYEEAIKGYSPEAIRGWKTLYEEQQSGDTNYKSLLDYASEVAPAMVRNKPKTGLGSYV